MFQEIKNRWSAANKTARYILAIAIVGVSVGGIAMFTLSQSVTVDGLWECTTAWSYEKDGVSVPVAVKARVLCASGQSSSTGVLSIGAADWSETIEATYIIDGDTVCETRTSQTTVAKNDAAREFESKELGGRTLESTWPEGGMKFCSQFNTVTRTQVTATNAKGAKTTCNRL